MSPFSLMDQTGHSHLRRLVVLRCIAIMAQSAALALAYRFLEMNLQWLPMLLTIVALAVLSFFTWLRLRNTRPVANVELFTQLCADVIALSILLYFSGGSTNPFISLFLLPLVITAATLPHVYTWAMTGITTACYTLLMKYYVPLPINHAVSSAPQTHHMSDMDMSAMAAHNSTMNGLTMRHAMPPDDAFNMHVLGMWLGFVISAVVISFFVVRMAYAVRERDETLAKIREETLRNERILALGIQAAGAAHELGTPLSTLAVIINELKRDQAVLPEWRENLAILDSQVQACKRILGKLLAKAQDSETQTLQPLEQFLQATLDEWQLLRPTVQCNYVAIGLQPPPIMSLIPALRAALLNLLNNAADASPEKIDIEANWNNNEFLLKIHDYGKGLTAEAAARAGSAFFTTKEEGKGLGLMLANATIERLGGKVRLFNRDGGGATTEVIIPIASSQ
jgi:two-component system sensor histidine kinase RegB